MSETIERIEIGEGGQAREIAVARRADSAAQRPSRMAINGKISSRSCSDISVT